MFGDVDTSVPPVAERRGSQRRRVLLGGKIVHGPGYTAECSVRDVNGVGARIKLPLAQAAPNDFYLIVVRDGVAHHARRVWTRGREAGVVFGESYDLSRPVPEHMRPIRRLWEVL